MLNIIFLLYTKKILLLIILSLANILEKSIYMISRARLLGNIKTKEQTIHMLAWQTITSSHVESNYIQFNDSSLTYVWMIYLYVKTMIHWT